MYAEVQILFADGYAKQHSGVYAALKADVRAKYAQLGMRFQAPEKPGAEP